MTSAEEAAGGAVMLGGLSLVSGEVGVGDKQVEKLK